MNRKKIMIIGAGLLQLPAIIKAKEMGLEIIAIDKDVNAPGFKFADLSFEISTLDIEQAVQIAKKMNPDGVMTLASDIPMRTVAAIGEACGLNTISTEVALIATNKGKMREQLSRFGLPIPNFYIAKSYDEFVNYAALLPNKFISKPVDNAGSRGVTLVSGKSNLKGIYSYSKEFSRSGEVILEEYMEGPEVSVEAMTIDGETKIVSITDKLTTGAPNFIEMGHSIPSTLDARQQDEIIRVTKLAINAIGINNGPSHTEVIYTNIGPKIVEIGARLGGDSITSDLVPLATGFNMIEGTIKLALDEKIEIKNSINKGAAIRFINCDEGEIKLIEYNDSVLDLKDVMKIEFTKKIGDYASKITSSNDRVGFVIAQGKSSSEAISLCNKAISLIKVTTEINNQEGGFR